MNWEYRVWCFICKTDTANTLTKDEAQAAMARAAGQRHTGHSMSIERLGPPEPKS